ncbi:hypothetical protein ABT187_40605 [Streptomyces sp. NPDC001817]|uniref:hypothetical protein n=1 Tax=Streptomyces sp. NPDC001817 TaxID=3154398 RepID=UPI003325C5F6
MSWHVDGQGGGTVFGHVTGNVMVSVFRDRASHARRPVRSAYLRQVERIAPPELLGRETEMAELADFCLDERCGPYVWWRAGPWAGKSALLSTFVLNAPALLSAGRVWMVSFFITARLAAQDTRDAFTASLTEQLCTLLGADLPVGGGEAAGEAALLDLLAQAATACRAAGGRLVLVVDGLDEDRSVTTGAWAHSIAGLLPGRPPAGMRVIVASRLNPPIPDDVPDWHPLRSPGVIRLLGDSSYARDVQRLSQSELKRLLAGRPVERDLLGLLTAARGGLSGPDLRELTRADLVTVEEVLHTVAGRTFTTRSARDDGSPQVYLLGHEELHNAASHYIGDARLARYRHRIHVWADSYRTRTARGRPPWPRQTPEYLLLGYPRMLAGAGDTARLAALALDSARHDRMLDLLVGDTAALAELGTSQKLLLDCPEPDLYLLARLSHHRGLLESRNAGVPAGLPAVWACLGRPQRAEALARAITDPLQQVRALAGVAGVAAESGERGRAGMLAAEAERLARAMLITHEREEALVEAARAMAAAGAPEQAERIARDISTRGRRSSVLTVVVQALTAAGERDRAEGIARTIAQADERAWALTEVAQAMAAAGEHERAGTLAAIAEGIAHVSEYPHRAAWALARAAGVRAAAGEHQRASRLVVEAEQVARIGTPSRWQVRALCRVAGAVAAAGGHQQARSLVAEAEQIARAVTAPAEQVQALADVAAAARTAGDHERALRLTVKAERTARTITELTQQVLALAEVASAAVTCGTNQRAHRLADEAERTARTITDPRRQVVALAQVAQAVARAGEQQRARRLADRAEQIARTVVNSIDRVRALTEVVAAEAAAGNYAQAAKVARTFVHRGEQVDALASVAGVAAAAGELQLAGQLVAEAEQLARAMTDANAQQWTLANVTRAAAAAGKHGLAERAARTITNPVKRAHALAELAGTVAAAGDHARAERVARTIHDREHRARALSTVAESAAAGEAELAGRLAEEAERLARKCKDPLAQVRALDSVVGALAALGRQQRAGRLASDTERVAHTIDTEMRKHWALAVVARAMAVAGENQHAERLARANTDQYWRERALADVSLAVATRGEHLQAEQLARAIPDPQKQAQALVSAAEAVGTPHAGHLLGRAFVLGSWLTPLPVMAKLFPAELIRIADAVYDGDDAAGEA